MKGSPKQKTNKNKIFYILSLVIAFLAFTVIAVLNLEIKRQISSIGYFLNPLSFETQNYPVINNDFVPEISARGAIVIDKNSQVILYQKNSNLRFPPASTAKIMTALVALEHFKPNDIITIKTATVEGSIIGFSENEKFRFEDLLFAMLLPSANDATLAIAQNYPGGEVGFVKKMNEKAKELHLLNTYYADPIGIEDAKDYTTALDLARLTSIALGNSELARIVATKNKTINSLSGNEYILSNLNKLLDLPGISGVKTGFTEGAGQVLVTSKKIQNNQDIIIVVLQSLDRFADTESLINYLGGLNYLPIHP